MARRKARTTSKREPTRETAPRSTKSGAAAPASKRPSAVRSSEPAPRVSEANRFRPPSADIVPGFAGVPSFLRLPVRDDPNSIPPVDVLLCGVPFDGGTSFRPGARFAPRAVREVSALSRSFSAALGVDIYDELRVADGGDVLVAPHDVHAAVEAMADRSEALTRSGVIPGFIGGDQTVTLGALRGIHRAKHKAVGLLHIDAHSNASPAVAGRDIHQASIIRCAVQEGLIKPGGAMQIGLRGPYSSSEDLAFSLSHGFEVLSVDEVRWDLHGAVSAVRKLVRSGALYVSVDVSVLDPSCAPGTGFPIPGGVTTWELQQLLRALVGAEIVGFDVVEIAPTYDPSGITPLVGVTILHEILSAIADTRRSARPAPSTHRSWGRRGGRVSA